MEGCKNPLTSLSEQLAPAAGWLWQNTPPCSCERESWEWKNLAFGFPHCLWAVSVSGSTHRCFLMMSSLMCSCWRYGVVTWWFFLRNGSIYTPHWKVALEKPNICAPPGKEKNPKHAQYYLKKIKYQNEGFLYDAAVEVESISLHLKMIHKSKLAYTNRNSSCLGCRCYD